MIEIRVHGRGGMGSITLVELLAKAIGFDDKFSQAFGAFGPERRGAPVRAFCRIDDKKITLRTQVYKPDYIVILDPTLLDLPEVSDGAKPNTIFIVNSNESPKKEQREIGTKNLVYTFDATSLALNVIGKDIVNTAMLGSFAKVTNLVTLKSVFKAIEGRFGGKLGELNNKLVNEAYKQMKV